MKILTREGEGGGGERDKELEESSVDCWNDGDGVMESQI